MNWFWIFTSVFAIIFFSLLFVPLGVFVEYKDKLLIRIKIGFISFKINFNKQKSDKKEKNSESSNRFKRLFKNKNEIQSISDFKKICVAAGKTAKYLLKKISVKAFYLNIKVGAPDTALAALRYGQVSSVMYPFCSVVNSFANPKSYKVQVAPDFMSEKINIIFKTNIKANLIKILCVMIKFMRNYKTENKK